MKVFLNQKHRKRTKQVNIPSKKSYFVIKDWNKDGLYKNCISKKTCPMICLFLYLSWQEIPFKIVDYEVIFSKLGSIDTL